MGKPDIILLTEVIPKALKFPILSPTLEIYSYTLYTNFDPDVTPPSNTRGIIAYISNLLNSKVVSFNSDFQEQFVRIELLSHYYLLVGTMYRSPSADPNISISNLCHLIEEVVE